MTTGLLGGAFDPPHVGHVAARPGGRGALRARPVARPRRRRAGPQARRDAGRGAARARSRGLRRRPARRGAAATTTPTRSTRSAPAASTRPRRSSSSAPTSSRRSRRGRSPTRSSSTCASASPPGPAIRGPPAPGARGPRAAPSGSSSSRSPPPTSRRPRSGRASRAASPWTTCFRPRSPAGSSSAASTIEAVDRPGQGSYAESVDSGDVRPLTPIDHARRIAALAQEKLAADVVILDMRPACSYTDFFVVCTGAEPAADEGDLRRGPRAPEEGGGLVPRTVAGEREATLDPRRLPGRRPARLHARGARVLPPRGALGRRARRSSSRSPASRPGFVAWLG